MNLHPSRSEAGFYDDPRLHALVCVVKAKRESLGLSQNAFAKLNHIERTSIQKFEQHKAQALSLRALLDLLGALDLQLVAIPVQGGQHCAADERTNPITPAEQSLASDYSL